MTLDPFLAPTPVNLVGWLGLALLGLSFQFRARAAVGLTLAAATLAMTLHYAGKEAWAAVAVAGTMIPGHVAGAFAGRHRVLRHVRLVLLPVLWGLTLMAFETWVDALPAAAVSLEVLGLTQSRTVIMRSGFIVSQPLWAAYNLAALSGPGLMANLLVFSSSVLGLLRHHPPAFLKRRKAVQPQSL